MGPITTYETQSMHRANLRARDPDRGGYATTAGGLRLYWELHGVGAMIAEVP